MLVAQGLSTPQETAALATTGVTAAVQASRGDIGQSRKMSGLSGAPGVTA
jgi:hypothetical protein